MLKDVREPEVLAVKNTLLEDTEGKVIRKVDAVTGTYLGHAANAYKPDIDSVENYVQRSGEMVRAQSLAVAGAQLGHGFIAEIGHPDVGAVKSDALRQSAYRERAQVRSIARA